MEQIDEHSKKRKKTNPHKINDFTRGNYNILDEFRDKHLTKKVIMCKETLLVKFHQELMEKNYLIRMLMDEMDL